MSHYATLLSSLPNEDTLYRDLTPEEEAHINKQIEEEEKKLTQKDEENN